MADIQALAASARNKKAKGEALTWPDAIGKAIKGKGIFHEPDAKKLMKKVGAELAKDKPRRSRRRGRPNITPHRLNIKYTPPPKSEDEQIAYRVSKTLYWRRHGRLMRWGRSYLEHVRAALRELGYHERLDEIEFEKLAQRVAHVRRRRSRQKGVRTQRFRQAHQKREKTKERKAEELKGQLKLFD